MKRLRPFVHALLRAGLRHAGIKRVARALVVRVPFLRRRAYALLAQQPSAPWSGIPVTPGDLSPRTAQALAQLERARKQGR